MAKYLDISANKLRTIADACLRELSTHNLASISREILNQNILTTDVSENIKNAISLIQGSNKNGSIAVLRKNLINLEIACEYMENIQNLNLEIRRLESKRWKTETHHETTTEYDVYGKPYEKTREYTVTVEDERVVFEINEKVRKINVFETEINSLLKIEN